MKEDELNKLIIQWFSETLPQGSVWHHSPNEGKRHVSYKKRLYALGMHAGWPDLELFVPLKGWKNPERKAAIFIELKVNKNKLTDNQSAVQKALLIAGQHVITCWTLQQVRAFLEGLLILQETPRRRIIEEMSVLQERN